MVDLKTQLSHIETEVNQAIQSVLETCQFINGPEVNAFTNELAEFLDVKHVIPCANGTDALQIGMMALGLKPGDEVIVPVHTYVATAEAIALLKLTPIFVDVNEFDFTIDVNQIEDKISDKTKLIVPVHLYGQCANMEAILKIAEKHGIYVMEDAAQSIGSDYIFSDGRKQKSGTIGNIGTTSFFPSKNLGCFGDGGAIFTNDDELAIALKQMANHGQSERYKHDSIGCNSRLDAIQAAILRIKLKNLTKYNNSRYEAAQYYTDQLNNVDGIICPKEVEWSTHVYHQYTIRLTNADRDQVKESLAEKGIPSMIYYPIPLHHQKAYSSYNSDNSFPVTELLSKQVLSLPMHSELNTETQDQIIQTLVETLK